MRNKFESDDLIIAQHYYVSIAVLIHSRNKFDPPKSDDLNLARNIITLCTL